MQNKKEKVEWVCLVCLAKKYKRPHEIRHIKDGICDECKKKKPVCNIFDIDPWRG